jgi:hypothetical protein
MQKKAMETNMKYMGQSFKSTIFTILPVILIFSWMNANFAYEPITPGEQFQITLEFVSGAYGNITTVVPDGIEVLGDDVQEVAEDGAKFTYKGEAGDYVEGNAVQFLYSDKKAFKEVIITDEPKYSEKEKKGTGDLKKIEIGYEKKNILPVLNWGWLGTYIIFSIIFSMSLRKILKVY